MAGPRRADPASRLLRSDALMDRIAKLALAAGLPEDAAIPLALIQQAIETSGGAAAFQDVVDEATLCQVLDCTRPTLARYIEMGMPIIRLSEGGRKWYSLGSVERWLRSHERSAAPRGPGRPAGSRGGRNGGQRMHAG
jgi:hypothetical protein